ncbi:uncharacterized protein LOC123316829 isoform X2 [Coccinella septempunctata]|uniref:uncharacterized protein LOC123316829 isoform X2 n=1 Tax=Coccinella septempunctata TaxID=41139 RepID=UPI001D082A98|nr:uncharacterized protein LOC123316829 isoform X2 [Coccinella septempunctata]
MSLLRLGSGFGRTSRGVVRTDDIEVVPRKFEEIPESYLRNRNNVPRIFVEPASLNELFDSDKFVSGSSNGRTSEYGSRTFPSEEFNQAD